MIPPRKYHLRSGDNMRLQTLSLLLAATNIARAATAAEWRSRSIYQILTDRFALTNDSTSVPCDPSLQHYCGGTWQGIISKLDYIQDMGFDAVIRPNDDHTKKVLIFGWCRYGSLQLLRK
jgi:alpha-amylase